MYIYIHTYIHTYIYIYIYREREIEREREHVVCFTRHPLECARGIPRAPPEVQKARADCLPDLRPVF